MISKPNALVYLRRNDLFIGGKRLAAVKMKFTPNLIKNLELLDTDLFITTCQEFFSAHGMRGKRVLLVLDQGIVFSKTIELNDETKDGIDNIYQEYIAEMPFEPGQRACVRNRTDTKLQLFAVNANLYQAVQEALRLIGVRKVVAISPAEVYNIDYNAKPNSVIDQFLDDKEIRRLLDFSTVGPQ